MEKQQTKVGEWSGRLERGGEGVSERDMVSGAEIEAVMIDTFMRARARRYGYRKSLKICIDTLNYNITWPIPLGIPLSKGISELN